MATRGTFSDFETKTSLLNGPFEQFILSAYLFGNASKTFLAELTFWKVCHFKIVRYWSQWVKY